MIAQLRAPELAAWRGDAGRAAPIVVDVRESWEYQLCRIEGSVHVPLGRLPASVDELPRDRSLVVVCHHGVRSQHAAAWLQRIGFPDVHNLHGGIEAWAAEVEPQMARY